MSTKLSSRLQQLGASRSACAEFEALLQPALPQAAHTAILRQGEPATHLHILEEGWAFSSKSLRTADARRPPSGSPATCSISTPGCWEAAASA